MVASNTKCLSTISKGGISWINLRAYRVDKRTFRYQRGYKGLGIKANIVRTVLSSLPQIVSF